MRDEKAIKEWTEKYAGEDYLQAKELGLTEKDRWEEGISHHPMSERLMKFIADHDFVDYNDCFCWKMGGDGDNGETLMYEMDAFFEMLDKKEQSAISILKEMSKALISSNDSKYALMDSVEYFKSLNIDIVEETEKEKE